jgi:hypothetical protein
MIVSQATIDQILSKARRRTIWLPAKGSKAPCRVGGVYLLRAPYPRREAERQPTRARAVLALIDMLETRKTVTITVTAVEPTEDGEWVVRFEKGAHRQVDERRLLRGTPPSARTCTAILKSGPRRGKACGRAFPDRDYVTDRPITVCACGAPRPAETIEDHGYTDRRMAAMRSEGEAVPEDMQKQITAQAKLNADNGYVLQRERLMAAISAIRPYARDRDTIKHLKGVERQLRSLVAKMMPAA